MARNQKPPKPKPVDPDRDEELDDGSPLKEEKKSPYRYYAKGERVRSDGGFFELLLSKALTEPGPVQDFDELWPRCTRALSGLNLRYLSARSEKEMADAVVSVGGEFTARFGENARELLAWAEAFWTIKRVYGSFRQYVRSFDSDGPEALIDDLLHRLTGVTPKFLLEFLRDAGEKISPIGKYEGKSQQGQRRGGRSRGSGRRRGGRGGNRGGRSGQQQNGQEKSPEKTVPEKPAQENKPQDGAKKEQQGGGRGRRGRRGFFKKRRGGRGNRKSQGQGDKPKNASA